MAADTGTIHASCVLVGEAGILIRGQSGSGKSDLALRLVAQAPRFDVFARLVSDDRVRLERRAGRLVARAVPVTSGLVEARGGGIMRVPHEPAAVVRLLVDCGIDGPRLPDATESAEVLCGIRLPRLRCRPDSALACLLLQRGGRFDDMFVTSS
jgi:serine kinase of HPr protein (carbohydrate metabolism regulator)